SGPLYAILSALFLFFALAVAAVILRRFLSDSPDVVSVLVALSLGLLCFVVGSTFTRIGRQSAERALSRFGLKIRARSRMALTLGISVIFGTFYLLLPV